MLTPIFTLVDGIGADHWPDECYGRIICTTCGVEDHTSLECDPPPPYGPPFPPQALVVAPANDIQRRRERVSVDAPIFQEEHLADALNVGTLQRPPRQGAYRAQGAGNCSVAPGHPRTVRVSRPGQGRACSTSSHGLGPGLLELW